MHLNHHLRHAIPHITHLHSKTHTPSQIVFDHPTEFHLTLKKHTHAKELFSIKEANSEHALYHILRCQDGLRLTDKHGEELYRTAVSSSDNTMRIRDARTDDIVITTRQRGQLFSIVQVFNGDGFYGKPFIEVCAALDYKVTEAEGGRLLATVEQVVRWSEPSHCSVHIATGLNAPLLLLLIASINHTVEI
ncbi:hypothetical protein BWQ96_09220 [Gracilariopsis chorda]|uniref:Uncharacterized protein n=1 Tax=Gracilariopsis chorda TaxID=448386 RepID=A0A2V3IIY6_9FLOR|nr:hypothetical protein BWQ96_09220 [Gracilariopsis chorda]|eukprot:PXF41080.1 hypothetical protein BWQ96_09220 [Gracilariopsis chorda]